MTHVADDPLVGGREAAARGAWREAYELLQPVAATLGPEDLEQLAEAAWWLGRLDEAIGLRERAQAGYLDAGERRKAAQVALVISGDYFGKADVAVSAGWFSKAERLLKDEPEGPEHGYLAFFQAANLLVAPDIDGAIVKADLAYEIGTRFASRDLQALALGAKGRALVLRGDATEGLALLDEATASAVSGELRPFSTGLVYCITITSCNGLGDYRRAAEWTKAAGRWCDTQDVKGFPGACRVHEATIKRLAGDWPEAEEQALQACQELQGFDAWTTAAGFYEIGEIRRRRGDFAAAEESYREAKEWGRDPQPGLALLRLAQGKIDAAVSGVTRSLATEDPMARLRRLPAQVEIALAAGDLTTARSAATELDELTEKFQVEGQRTPAFQATVCLAWGQISLAEGDAANAAKELERSVGIWREIGIPYETAEAQKYLGLALRRLGDEDAAIEELTAARSTFVRLGAVLDGQRISELLGEVPVTRTFMFTDIVDSTKLAEALGEAKWAKLLAWHDRTLRDLLQAEGGEVIKQTGDGFFAAFDSPAAGVEAAVSVQRALDGYEGIAPDVRIGLHAGGAFAKDEGDYGGQGVHAAARIGALGGAGEILVSSDTLADTAIRYPVKNTRSEELKGIEEPVEITEIAWR
jgi:class 3 adenylate cyclase